MIALGLKLRGQSLREVVGISGRLPMSYIFADGELKLQPKIIFSGTPTEEGGRILADEGYLYAEGVTVEYNKTAYNNERLFKSWVHDELGGVTDSRDFLLVMDVASFHTTEDVMADLRKAGVTVALIPSGCTGLLQPLDVSVNKPFKQWVREEVERLEDKGDPAGTKKWSTKERRVMITYAVAAACKKLEQRPELVINSFVKCGISIRPDGSEDNLIDIKDIPSEKVDFTGWEIQEQMPKNPLEAVDKVLDGDEVVVLGGDEFELRLRGCKVVDLKHA